MKIGKSVGAALMLGALLVAVSGCEKEGPAERAGKSVDETLEKAGDQIEKAGDRVKDAVEGEKK